MVTTLYLIRHGETEGSDAKRYKGSIDVPLSEQGIRQVEQASLFIAEHLRNYPLSRHQSYLRDAHKEALDGEEEHERLKAVYTSDLSRAVKSGEIIAAPHRIIPESIPELRERNFGIWEGMSFIEIRDQYPEEFNAWVNSPVKFSPAGGESTYEVKKRVLRAMKNILSSHRGETIAVVAHGGVNRVMLCHIMGMPLKNIFRIEQDFSAVNVIEFWEDKPVVKLMNRGSHG